MASSEFPQIQQRIGSSGSQLKPCLNWNKQRSKCDPKYTHWSTIHISHSFDLKTCVYTEIEEIVVWYLPWLKKIWPKQFGCWRARKFPTLSCGQTNTVNDLLKLLGLGGKQPSHNASQRPMQQPNSKTTRRQWGLRTNLNDQASGDGSPH